MEFYLMNKIQKEKSWISSGLSRWSTKHY